MNAGGGHHFSSVRHGGRLQGCKSYEILDAKSDLQGVGVRKKELF